MIAIERALLPWGLALAALARHENRRYVHYPPRSTGDGPVRRGVQWSAGFTPPDQQITQKFIFNCRNRSWLSDP